jgi:hypothetical protein
LGIGAVLLRRTVRSRKRRGHFAQSLSGAQIAVFIGDVGGHEPLRAPGRIIQSACFETGISGFSGVFC